MHKRDAVDALGIMADAFQPCRPVRSSLVLEAPYRLLPAPPIISRMPVDVTSEIGTLQTVLVHTPGHELEAVTPGNREDYLYDEIIDLEIAQREHRQFVSVLRRFADVLQVRDLLADILAPPE